MWKRIGLPVACGVLLFAASPASAQPVSPMIAQQIDGLAAMAAPGQVAVSPVWGGFLAWRRPYAYFADLQPGQCYTILGMGGPGVVDLDLFLFDPSNRRVASDLETNNTPRMSFCATFPGTYRIEAKVKRGAGEAAVRVYAPMAGVGRMGPPPHSAQRMAVIAPPPPTGADSDEDYPPPPPARMVSAPGMAAPPPAAVMAAAPPATDPLSAQVDTLAASRFGGAFRIGDHYRGMAMEEDGRTDWYVTLDMGRCYNFVGAGGPGVRALSLYLWFPTGKRATQDRAPQPISSLTFCAPMPGLYHLQAKVSDGRGEYRVGVYTK